MNSTREKRCRNPWRQQPASGSLLVAGLVLVSAFTAQSARAGDEANKAFEGLSFSAQTYIEYSAGKTPAEQGKTKSYNQFALTRGYFTLKKKIAPWLSMRLTSEVTQDATGDYKVRQKYFYAELRPRDIGPLTGMVAEVGMGNIPWLDFEGSINPYRAQGTMAIERAGAFNSVDLGVSLRGDFGGTLADGEKTTGSKNNLGRYGSWHLGIYNGGGYNAPENNENKTLEGRLTVRPLSAIIPGLQLSYFGIFGKGNAYVSKLKAYPDLTVNMGMASFQHPLLTLSAQYFATKGNQKGTWVDTLKTRDALSTAGFSVFGNVRLPDAESKISVFGRMDWFDVDHDHVIADKSAYTMSMGGVSYRLYSNNLLLLTYEVTKFEDNSAGKGKLPVVGYKSKDDQRMQAVYQLSF